MGHLCPRAGGTHLYRLESHRKPMGHFGFLMGTQRWRPGFHRKPDGQSLATRAAEPGEVRAVADTAVRPTNRATARQVTIKAANLAFMAVPP